MHTVNKFLPMKNISQLFLPFYCLFTIRLYHTWIRRRIITIATHTAKTILPCSIKRYVFPRYATFNRGTTRLTNIYQNRGINPA